MLDTDRLWVCLPHRILCYDEHAKMIQDSRWKSGFSTKVMGKLPKICPGTGNDGELKEGAKWEDGQFGQAVIFDGKDDYVEIAPSLLFNPEVFTVTFWMHPTAVGGNNPGGKGSATLVIANGNPGDGGGANWWFEFWNGGNFEFKKLSGGLCRGEHTRE
ncbi:hypothetical protein GBAR_LOCUS19726 [Geodia barretti]|uniref:Uncharacterized protein n=1 Tax=Geodia barretti TaxID=519541 RepID=A0AA35STM1_GEOBA|nr:hypothetical protein GBAR_LOCUS19726 [Geodia barretti]